MFIEKPPVSGILRMLDRIAHTGTLNIQNKELLRRTILVNKISLITAIIVMIIGGTFYGMLKHPAIGIPVVIESLLFLSAIAINARKHYHFAAIAMFFTHCLFAFYYGLLLEALVPIHLLIVFLILSIPLIFKEKSIRTICVVCAVLTMALLQISNFYNLMPSFRLQFPRNFMTEFLPFIGILALIFFVGLSYIRSKDYNHQLKEANAKLEELNTQFVAVNQQLEESNKSLEVANQHKRRFLSGTVHDIRTFQNAISGNTQMLLRDAVLDDGMSAYLPVIKDIYAACNGVSEEINDVLDIESIEAGKAEIVRKEAFRLSAFIQSIMRIVRISALQKKIKMKLITGDDCPNLLKEDPLKLRKIIINLLSNAIKFADFESEVFLKITRKEDSLLFEVVNQGVVIKADQLSAIFNPFISSAGGYVEGTGLGLYLVKHKVELLGGTIVVRSNKYETSFLVTLPLCEASPTELHETEMQLHKDLSSYKVLVIEDNEMNGKLLVNFLGGWGCNVTWAKDGHHGLLIAKQEKPDIILLDVELPGISGKDVLKTLKEDKVLKSIPVIIASGAGYQQQELVDEGADSFLLKPIDYKTVKSEMSRLIKTIKTIAVL